MALVIGSAAMYEILSKNRSCTTPKPREPKDLDLFAHPDDPELKIWQNASLVKVEPFWHDLFSGTQLDRSGFATLDELYTIKHSHVYWELKNGSWDKHMSDLLLMKRLGATLNLDLHNILYKVWIDTHGSKKMNLAQAAGDFFDDAVVRIYDHDSIHDSVAFGERPLYERILKDGETVDIDPDKMWNGLTFDEQVSLFREEIAATALERWMIPTKYKFSPGLAYKLALRKTIVSLTKGRSARFIVSNFEHFATPHPYMNIHMQKKHLLKPLDPFKKGMS